MIPKKTNVKSAKQPKRGIYDTPTFAVNPSKQPKGTIFGAPNTAANRAKATKMLSRNYR